MSIPTRPVVPFRWQLWWPGAHGRCGLCEHILNQDTTRPFRHDESCRLTWVPRTASRG